MSSNYHSAEVHVDAGRAVSIVHFFFFLSSHHTLAAPVLFRPLLCGDALRPKAVWPYIGQGGEYTLHTAAACTMGMALDQSTEHGPSRSSHHQYFMYHISHTNSSSPGGRRNSARLTPPWPPPPWHPASWPSPWAAISSCASRES